MFADVIVDIASSEVDKIFEYSFTDDKIVAGSRVVVPFGSKKLFGIVIGIKETSEYPPEKIKPIISLLEDIPALTKESLLLMDYIRKRYFITTALALRLFLPSEMRLGKVKELLIPYAELVLTDEEVDKVILSMRSTAKQQIKALNYLKTNKKDKLSVLNNEFSYSAMQALIKNGYVKTYMQKELRSPYGNLDFSNRNITLTNAQENAISSINSTEKKITLLHGVTGSGKTEVYLNLISQTIAQNKTAIMLVPEIALTPQMLKQLRARFGDTAAILHSGLSNGERFDEWWRIRNGDAKIVIGARSAIFAPVENLGLIIIDEEHDSSYSSEQSPRYKTLEIAEFRANFSNAKIVLGSATPAVESYLLAKTGEYNLVKMPDRINRQPLPEVIIADMKSEVRRGNNTIFSSHLKDELADCLKKGNQAILFLNQRGYSKSVICTECGHVHKCDACDVALTYHSEDNSLLCHYCGAKYKMVTSCISCGSKYLKYSGTGTEKIVYDLKKMFPDARILRMDRDTTSTKEGHYKILKEFSEHNADILVGTQMIAKGHDFPKVTLVGILDADMSLHFSDFRSGERTFQLITQVAGRSGRAEEKGKVVLQTYTPENFILRQAVKYDYEKMYEHEISVRKATGFPPFTDIVRVIVSSEDEDLSVNTTREVYNKISDLRIANNGAFRFLACMKAPIKKIQNKFRYQVIMRLTSNRQDLIDKINEICDTYNNKVTGVYVEVNPNNLN